MNLYSMLLGAGAAIGLARVAGIAPVENRLRRLITALVVQAAALIGARAGYVFEHSSYYSSNFVESLQPWQGGLTWQGAVLGAIVGLILFCLISRSPLLPALDCISLMIAPLAALIWMGCWTEGIGYGDMLPQGTWWGIPSADVNGQVALRVPIQLAASLSLLLFLGILEFTLKRVKQSGVRGGLAGLVFALHMLLFTFFRADPAPSLLGLRLETWYAILIAGIFFFGNLAIWIVSRSAKPNDRRANLLARMKDIQQ